MDLILGPVRRPAADDLRSDWTVVSEHVRNALFCIALEANKAI